MRAKEFFMRARHAEADIERLEAMIEHWESVGTGITSKWGYTPPGSGANHSKVELAVLGIVAAEEGVLSELEAYRKIVLEAEKVISMISQSRFRQILSLHYLAGLSLAEVGTRLKYQDRNSIYRAHGYALSEAQKIIDLMEAKDEIRIASGRENDLHPGKPGMD